MTTVLDIMHFLEALAPTSMKYDWDRVGLNCGRTTAPVTKILVALDPFEAIDEAMETGADLLITHHPLLWKPDFITDRDLQGQRMLKLIENRIAHINAHTNLDCAPEGVNDALAEALGLANIRVIDPIGTDAQGRDYGLLRMGQTRHSLESFLAHVKNSLGCQGLRYVAASENVRKVAVGGGACASAFQDVIRAGCDTFVTSDIKYNQFRDAFDLGLNLIDAGHFHTERPVCAVLAEKLQSAFPDIPVNLSEKQLDPMKFY